MSKNNDKPTNHDKPKLNDEKVLCQAKKTLEIFLPLEADGYCVTSETLYDILIGIAANRGTTESVCAELADAPDPETIRRYFREQFVVDQLQELERSINDGLAANWPKKLRRSGPIEVAIDFHDRPYYGKQEQEEALYVRGEAKDGTTRFYRVATAYAILHGQRVTLAIRFVLPGDQTVEVVRDLRQRLLQRAMRIGVLYLDKGFSGVPVLKYLRRCQQPSLIACPIRGKKGGTRALCRGRASYRAEYTFNEGNEDEFTAQLAVCRVFTTSRRTKRGKRRAAWLLFIMIALDWTPERCRQRYRKRFGVETSYRLGNKQLGWTTSPNPAYRFLLIGLGFLLLNLWVHLCWLYTQVAHRGRRAFAPSLFRQVRFLNFLKHALERIYGTVNKIRAPAAPLL
ncbi:MAG: transposase [Nitrososphaera sp.]